MSSTANVWVNKDTKVICQGITGKQVFFSAETRGHAICEHTNEQSIPAASSNIIDTETTSDNHSQLYTPLFFK